MLTMAVSFFTLIAGSVGKIDKYIGCQSKFKGIFKYWDETNNARTQKGWRKIKT